MSRESVPFHAADISTLAKTLKTQFDQRFGAGASPPTHVQWLGLLAKAVGYRNFQHMKSALGAPEPLPLTEPDVLSATAQKALLQFDDAGRLTRLPNKLSVQRMCTWWLWTRFDARRRYRESDVNAVLKAWQTFGDHVTLRRELVNMALLSRTEDGSAYRKENPTPPAEVQAFLRALRQRAREAKLPRGKRPPWAGRPAAGGSKALA